MPSPEEYCKKHCPGPDFDCKEEHRPSPKEYCKEHCPSPNFDCKEEHCPSSKENCKEHRPSPDFDCKDEHHPSPKEYCKEHHPIYANFNQEHHPIPNDREEHRPTSETVLCPILWGINYHIFMPVRLDEISNLIVDTRLKFV